MALTCASPGGEPAETLARLRFRPFGTGLPISGQWREGFRIADVNRDGHPDLVHGPARKRPGPPVIFLQDGKGSWSFWKEARFPPLRYDYGDVEVADFDRDGIPDLALAVHLRGVYVLRGDGRGGFSNASSGLGSEAENAPTLSSRALRSTDWNGDGLIDLIAAWEGPMPGGPPLPGRNGTVIYLNRGPKGWEPEESLVSPGDFSDSLALGDFDGDGHVDVAMGSGVLGRKDLVHLWRKTGKPSPLGIDLPGQNHYVQAVAAGDFDQDKKDDLAVAYVSLENETWYSVTDVLYSRAGGKWERRTLSRDASRYGAVALASGRLRPGKTAADLAAVTARGETIVYLPDGRGGFAQDSGAIPVYNGGCRGSHVELADLDGDGVDEIVTSFADEPGGGKCPTGGGIRAWKAVSRPQ